MILEQFQQIKQKELASLISCRKIAYEEGTNHNVVLSNDKFWDLLAFFKDQWHYITTIKK
jgi:hypothetical protein